MSCLAGGARAIDKHEPQQREAHKRHLNAGAATLRRIRQAYGRCSRERCYATARGATLFSTKSIFK